MTRLVLRVGLAVAISGVAFAGCSGDGGGKKDSPEPLRADMTGAYAVAVLQPIPDEDPPELYRLFEDGSPPELVLNQEFIVDDVAETTTQIILIGYADALVTSGGGIVKCTTIAVPKDAADEPVPCLGPSLSPATPTQVEGRRFVATRDAEVFFAFQPDPGAGEIRRWDGSSDYTVTIMANGLSAPYAHDGVENICVAGAGPFLCGNPDSPPYQEIEADSILQLDRFIIGETQTIDLLDLSIVATTGGGGVPNFFDSFPTPDGGLIGRVGPTGLSKALPPNRLLTIGTDGAPSWGMFVASGNYGFAYREDDLRRVDLTTAVVGSANFLANVQLATINSMALTTNDRIRLDGFGLDGFAAIVYVDVNSGEVSTDTSDGPTYNQIVYLE